MKPLPDLPGYRLNSNYGWKGKVRNLDATRFHVIKGGKDDTSAAKEEEKV